MHCHKVISNLGFFHILTGQNNGNEKAVLAANGNHTVRGGGVIVNAVTLA